MKKWKKFLALLLCFGMALSSFAACDKDNDGDGDGTEQGGGGESGGGEGGGGEAPVVDFDQPINGTIAGVPLTYTLNNADMAEYETLVAAARSLTIEGLDTTAIEEAWEDLLEKYYHIASQSNIAYILYCANLEDEVCTAYYEFSSAASGDAYSLYNELCVDIYESESPYKEEFFSDWSQSDINDMLGYSDDIKALQDENDSILIEFRKLDSSASSYASQTADFYKRLVKNNNTIARHFKDEDGENYENYYDYAYDNVYIRDYERADMAKMRDYVGDYIFPLWQTMASQSLQMSGENSKFYRSFNEYKYSNNATVEGYWNSYVNSFEGSTKEGFEHMFINNNYAFGSRKGMAGAFTTTIYDTDSPFCYFGPEYQNVMTLAHEVGHYYAELHEEGSLMYDLAEIHSQGNEFMFLSYLEDEMTGTTDKGANLSSIYKVILLENVASSLEIIWLGTVIDYFEQYVYDLSDDELENCTSAQFDGIMRSVLVDIMGTTNANAYSASINNYWRAVALTSPVYYISYATSAIASLNLYLAVEEDCDAGREIYRKLVEEIDYTTGFVGNLAQFGLASPFEEQTYKDLRSLLMSKF